MTLHEKQNLNLDENKSNIDKTNIEDSEIDHQEENIKNKFNLLSQISHPGMILFGLVYYYWIM